MGTLHSADKRAPRTDGIYKYEIKRFEGLLCTDHQRLLMRYPALREAFMADHEELSSSVPSGRLWRSKARLEPANEREVWLQFRRLIVR